MRAKLQKNVAWPFSRKFKFLLFHFFKTMSGECRGQILGDDAVKSKQFFNLTIRFKLSQIRCCVFVIYLKQRSLSHSFCQCLFSFKLLTMA